jgi:alkylation response protein AidB-like acyl-CoA dehydrogenase
MDFVYHYTEDQELFRQEVRAWLEGNISSEMREPVDPADPSEEMFQYWRQKNRELGAKGWLFPTYPKEYGGGGLNGEHETILNEEFNRAGVSRIGSTVVLPSLLVWGTEEQKQKFLKPLLTGERIAWQKFTEPHSGADLASYESKAVRDGDEWVLNGSSVFAGGHETDQSWYYGPMVTDKEAPRHRNLGYFMIPYPHPGVEIRWMNLVHGQDKFNRKTFLFLDDVRLPADHLIGDDHNGWQVTNTSLEQEHGGRGKATFRDDVVDSMVGYMKESSAGGKHPGGNPVLQQTVMAAYIDARVDELIGKRTYWMYTNRKPMSWEGPGNALFGREYRLRNVGRARHIMGMPALLGTHDPLTPHGGVQEVFQRTSFVSQHGAGSLNIAKVVLARRIGISRTKERPAPTPATATQYAA